MGKKPHPLPCPLASMTDPSVSNKTQPEPVQRTSGMSVDLGGESRVGTERCCFRQAESGRGRESGALWLPGYSQEMTLPGKRGCGTTRSELLTTWSELLELAGLKTTAWADECPSGEEALSWDFGGPYHRESPDCQEPTVQPLSSVPQQIKDNGPSCVPPPPPRGPLSCPCQSRGPHPLSYSPALAASISGLPSVARRAPGCRRGSRDAPHRAGTGQAPAPAGTRQPRRLRSGPHSGAGGRWR